MRTYRLLPLLAVLVLILLVASACSSAPSTSAPQSSQSGGAGQTASQLASQGQVVFAQNCAKCHGDKGQGITGPALIGPENNLVAYQTGQGLYNFISTLMPNDKPGSLSPQQYLEVESYILLQNNFVKADTPVSPGTLASISLSQ